MVWQSMRRRKPAWMAVAGAAALVCYGFACTLQPVDDFGRLFAIYGGMFIGMSLVWGRVVDNMELDLGDAIGGVVCVVGASIVLFWPRGAKPPAPGSGSAGEIALVSSG